MKNKSRNKIIILILVFFISIGFAYLSSNLSINGNIGYSKNSWDIYFDNIIVNENSIEADVPTIENKTTINFSCLFNQPGSFYDFTVDIVNKGTIDAMIDEITKSTLSEEYANYLEYDVTYLDGTEISKYDALPSGARLKLKVKVQYKYDIAEIPNLEEINLSTSLTYLLADENALFGHGEYWNFDYKGSEDIFVVPTNGIYLLETWGAQGGDAGKYNGGYGAYSTGNILFQKGQEIYLNVGNKPLVAARGTEASGGYNGGGLSVTRSATDTGGAGGGATSIALKSGLLKDLEQSKNEIIIVSGAGGGAYSLDPRFSSSGGSAGGINGSLAPWDGFCTDNRVPVDGSKADQNTGGTSNLCGSNNQTVSGFGLGGIIKNYTENTNRGWFSGGGSGWYGGGAGYAHGANGGSSYIGYEQLSNKSMYCYNCEESTEESTKTISTINVSEKPISQYAKIGNGYARITYLGKS